MTTPPPANRSHGSGFRTGGPGGGSSSGGSGGSPGFRGPQEAEKGQPPAAGPDHPADSGGHCRRGFMGRGGILPLPERPAGGQQCAAANRLDRRDSGAERLW